MLKTTTAIITGLICGIILTLVALHVFKPYLLQRETKRNPLISSLAGKQVIGFLPYWLLPIAKKDYSPFITTLTYFGVRIDTDGTILKLTDPQEEEPGWHALSTGKLDSFFHTATEHGVNLSLVAASGNNDTIDALLNQPDEHAQKLVTEVMPLFQKYKFTDLNLDIEYSREASDAARANFIKFINAVRTHLESRYSITVEITSDDLIRTKLIDPQAIATSVDYIVIMAYDYHYPGSSVSGAIAPLRGAGTEAEYDVTSALELGLQRIPASKLVLGMPLYGYAWETLSDKEYSATIPGTGEIASNLRSEQLVNQCATCSAQFNMNDQEMFIVYTDPSTGTTHQISYPDIRSTESKITLANSAGIGGLALWALGYDGDTILNPLRNYR